MCVNQRPIRNPYTGHWLYVKCGKCPACLAEKAQHRLSRIKNTSCDDYDTLMVTLTYNRFSVPYVFRNEAYDFSRGLSKVLNVYRDTSYRKVRLDSDYNIGYRKYNQRYVVDKVDYVSDVDFIGNKDLKYQPEKIGICFYKDLQRFFGRLRINLKRKYSYDKIFKTYNCSEYGSKTLRPHFHMLFFIPKGDFETFRSAIVESWPFSDLRQFPRAIEKAFRAGSYVASYVNLSSDFPHFLKDYFPPKHSYSKGFGMGNKIFTLDKILELYKRGTMCYNSLQNTAGISRIVTIPFPKYVIHRFFPKFVGYSRINPLTLVSNIKRVLVGDAESYNESVKPLYLNEIDFHKSHVRLKNAYHRFLSECPDNAFKHLSMFEYCKLHKNIWNLYNSTVLKLHLLNFDIPLNEKYDNLDVVYDGVLHGNSLPVGFTHEMFSVTDPNDFLSNRVRTQRLAASYHDNIKHRKVNNLVTSFYIEEF